MSNSYAFVDPSYDNFLMHYRIKDGSKNGVRRWENYDGHLTPAGKERYSVYWEKGLNLRGKKVDYGNESTKRKGPKSDPVDEIRKKLDIGTANYEKPDGSLTAAGKKKFGDILTKKEMENLVRNYNKTNGTNYKVGEVTFRKNGKLYSSEGKRVDEDLKIESLGVAKVKRDLFGGDKTQDDPGLLKKVTDTKYKQQMREMNELSNEDLKKAIERSKLEKEYIRELGIQKSRGEKFIDNIKDSAVNIATDIAKESARELGLSFLNNVIVPKFTEAIIKDPEQAKKEAKRANDSINNRVNQADKKRTEQEKQQKNQGNKNTNSIFSKPPDQTSTKDLKSLLGQYRKDLSESDIDKLSRPELIEKLNKINDSKK